ncbi:LOG family protein [Alkalicoccobacillus plakortidis]|uniref:Cytokinin riboside 5'-monophosphate phosphoribohydrolase n=1 Tax=Alkalicoccobacillus plakortidis TaxID=444060 RepID=A0ABT0XQ94_9BACI|nr:TIGR00730 family Rossman fold protein [Alkalicoccobacillus plakortidis]MCM2677992.1 TIGR00730 family Rossman fold protein [Alkalicoccobacillus plakortidis]
MKRVAVFCGSSEGSDPIYMEQARKLGALLADKGIGLVYGGAQVGCMGAVADACLEAGGEVIGVIPEKLMNVEIAHSGLTEQHIVKTMHERKAMMADLSDAFIALPGGAGTLEEWFEVFTWSQLGYHHKPCSFLNVNNFYDPLLQMLEHTIEQGFMRPAYQELIITENSAEELLEKLHQFQPLELSKWGN